MSALRYWTARLGCQSRQSKVFMWVALVAAGRSLGEQTSFNERDALGRLV